MITATHIAFRERSEFPGQLDKSGGNANLIDYLRKEVVTNTMLRERLLKEIADDLPMKEGFEQFCDFMRDAASDMDDTGKGNEDADCTTLVIPHFRSATIPTRGKNGQFAVTNRKV